MEIQKIVLVHVLWLIFSLQVYNDRTGQITGFIYGDKTRSTLASHILVFMVQGLVDKHFKSVVGYFGTTSASSGLLYPLLWEAVYHLERQCHLKVCHLFNNSYVFGVSHFTYLPFFLIQSTLDISKSAA
jgi:hypothetical protein